MLKEKIVNLKKYYSLDHELSKLDLYNLNNAKISNTFMVDKEHSKLFIVENGEANCATSWRDNENNREVTGVINAKEGEFVLYLPGEPYVVRYNLGSVVKEA